jgi:hypothetical protein
MPQPSFPVPALFCGVVLVAAGVRVLAHSGLWPQAAIVGAAGSIVLLLLTFTAVVVVGACHRHRHRCAVLAHPQQVT